MATAPTDIDDIRQRMAQIRRELHEDVQGVVAGAEAVADWRRWIRNYPWASVGVAVAVGFLLVPRKHRTHQTIHITHPDAPLPTAIATAPTVVPEKKKRKSLLLQGLGLLVPVALRAGQGYALQFAEQWMAQRLQAQGQAPFDFASVFGGQAAAAPPPPPPRPGAQADPRRF